MPVGPHGSNARQYPLRGRSVELGIALRAVRAEPAALIVVEGEPGIGKTAFVGEVAEQARRMGCAIGAGTAGEQDGVSPLVSLGQALRGGPTPLVGSADFLGLAPLLGQPLWLAEQLSDLLGRRAAAQPLLVLLDDVHWADPLSRFVLRIVTVRLADQPITWLLAGRPQAGGLADQVADAAGTAIAVHRITLPALTTDAVLELAADRLGGAVPDHLDRRLRGAGGSPFIAVHVAEGLLTTDLPTGLVDGVRRRAAGLSRQAGVLLRTGAVLGARFTLADVATLTDVPAADLSDALTEAIAAGFVADDGVVVSFRHDLFRQALYQDVPPSARRARRPVHAGRRGDVDRRARGGPVRRADRGHRGGLRRR